MCDQNERCPFFFIQTNEKLQHVPPILAVQISGRLIRKQHRGLHHKRARQRNALLFASRELCGIVITPVGETHAFQ